MSKRIENLNVICHISHDGTVIPIRIRTPDDEGELQTYNVQQYRQINHDSQIVNMKNLFHDSFGCDIASKDPGKRLFFTNYSLGYRKGSETGGMTKKILREDKELFDDLIAAIKPKIIICLGKLTYEAVTDIKVENYVQTLKAGYPLQTLYQGIPTFGVPHCGSLGQRNVDGFDNMKRIWMNIADSFGSPSFSIQ